MAFSVFALLLATVAPGPGYVGSKTCATCHSAIAKSYAMTAMARASGKVGDVPLANGEVVAAKAGVTYSVTSQGGKPQLHYREPLADGTVLEGSKTLSYYIGSGTHGRGFIFEEQGQPFQAPVAYYGQERGWNVAPGYENEKTVFLARKAEPACLNCHSSGLKPIDAGLFEEGAASCERCHGPGEAHVRTGGNSALVNPAKLEAERRDSVCAQCHITGEARIVKAGRSETSYRPGDLLGEDIVPFVWSVPDKAQFKVVGHFEGLWQSKCKRMSGEKLSCLTCHDPHGQVAETQKSSYYRQKCLGCHEQTACKAPAGARNLKGDSCIACHMQQRASTDGQHTAFTDHSIRRTPAAEETPLAGPSRQLVAFWPARATDRDYALAYAEVANGPAAFEKLKAVSQKAGGDAELAAQLAYGYSFSGEPQKAEELYRQALKADPENLLALTNLGTFLAQSGQIGEAISLWRKAVAINPGLEPPGINLARGEWQQGHAEAARAALRQVLSLHPESAAARDLWARLR